MHFAVFRIGAPMKFTDHDYTPISLKLGISSIQSVVERLDLIYLGKILNNMFDCSSIVNGMNLNAPMRLLRELSYSFKLLYPTDPFSFKSVTKEFLIYIISIVLFLICFLIEWVR